MPMCFIEGPSGIHPEAKRRLMEKTCAALDAAYHLGHTRTFLREYQPADVAQDGRTGAGFPPVCFVEGPAVPLETKKRIVEQITAAVVDAYGGQVEARLLPEIMVFLHEYPLENVGLSGRLQADNPRVVEAVRAVQA